MRSRGASRVAVAMIRGYQWLVAPLLPSACRYVPTCSEYAREAYATHGVSRGTMLTMARLLRCHPWGSWGEDPVPSKEA